MSSIENFPFLQKSINQIISDQGFNKDCVVNIKDGTKKGEGFLGEIYFVSIADTKKALNIVVKGALRNEIVREKFVIKNIYDNEIYFYSKIYPALKQFEAETGASHHFTSVAKCYGYSNEVGAETVCLENLVNSGYEVLNKTSLFDENYVKLVFDKYAHLHALSFAYQNKKPEEYNVLISKIDNIWSKMEFDAFISTMSEIAKELCEYFKQAGNSGVVEKLKKYAEHTNDVFFGVLKFDSKYKAILHGDSWSNNMMFKYDKNASKKIPIDMKLLDFQICIVDSPARDLTYAFYTSASKKEFDQTDKFLQFYYEKFSMYAKDLKCDPEKLYPFEDLKEDFKKFSTLGFLLGLIINKSKLTTSEQVKDLNDLVQENCEFMPGSFDKEEFEQRAKNLVMHFYESNLL